MSSPSFQEQKKDILKAGRSSKILLYLDNDPTDQKVKSFFTAEFEGITEDYSSIYQGHKDFNDFLKARLINKKNR